jgi:molybdopterin-guanine dinucleotide biosynthesis protein A
VWHITAKETVNFKRSKFFMAKSDMPKDMCDFMQQEKSRGHPISIIKAEQRRQELVTLAHSQEWKLETILRTLLAKHPSKIFMRNSLSQ